MTSRTAALHRVLLWAPSPKSVMASMPPQPKSQRAWFQKLCADMSAAMEKLPEPGKRN